MPALLSLPNPARVAANRANAARSTGPKTATGKARSRANALRHGLTGAGIALPIAAEAEVAAQFAAIEAELAPGTAVGAFYARRVALAMVRADRAARHEATTLAHRVRHAATAFDAAHHATIDAAHAALGSARAARAAHRALLGSPEGLARLDADLQTLRACLTLPDPLWSSDHATRLDACQGVAPDPALPTRAAALSAALLGAPDLLTHADHAAIAKAATTPAAFAQHHLVALIDAERATLRDLRADHDPTPHARDRAEAAARAVFDPSPAAQLARRYEAAAVREVRQALDQLRLLEPSLRHDPEVALASHDPRSDQDVAGERLKSQSTSTPPTLPLSDATLLEPIHRAASVAAKPCPDQDLMPLLASFGRDRLTEAGSTTTAVATYYFPPGPGGD